MSDNTITKTLAVIEALKGREVFGLTPSEIAERAHLSQSNATRYRQDLQHLGYVEEVPDMPGRYRLGPKLVQIALAHEAGLRRAKQHVADTEQRFSRTPY